MRLIKMNRFNKIVLCAAFVCVMTSLSFADTLLDTGIISLNSGDLTQLGRISRDTNSPQVPQDWTMTEPFRGVANPTTTYFYRTFTIPGNWTAVVPYIQITIDDALPNLFVSVYSDSYNPANLAQNWLGDAAQSGNYNFTGVAADPRYFQVVANAGQNLIIVVNTTPGGTGGLGENFELIVDGFTDADFDVPANPVPEPGSLALLGSGLLGFGAAVRRRFMN